MADHILAIDQGTTSTRAIVFDASLKIIGVSQQEFPQHYPRSGWVEHDPEDLWRTAVETSRRALAKAGVAADDLAGIGIASQRETVVVWERATGKPIHKAIVWQDRRTAELCARLRADGCESEVAAKTGLLLDPYFSATKVAWLLDEVPGARPRAERGELAFGTVDSFLLWRLTGGKAHVTDATNASRTLLYDIQSGRWDEDLLSLLRVPAAVLPEVKDCAAEFGLTEPSILGAAIPVRGVAGDQQAATIGQACFEPGMLKSTYGTGCFALLNTGADVVASRHRLLTTIAYQLGGKRTYALEGAIFVAGAAVQWLRDGLGALRSAAESGPMAAEADPEQDVILVPAFVGLGAPHWDADARGAIFGLTRATGAKELAKAALESVCFQTADLIDAMRRDWGGVGDTVLRVDGGMVASDWMMQRLADLIGAPVDRPSVLETTALGAAYLAGLEAGLCPAPAEFARTWALERRFLPSMLEVERTRRLASWRSAVTRLLAPM
ncbi:MAG TPA: glycerol kinase GlpK [Roseiarcus sp.]|nr:glycerol kinase GlpK [Roseiarcus sp.]